MHFGQRTSTPEASIQRKTYQAIPVSEKTAEKTRRQVIRLYGGGIAVFIVIFASISAAAVFFAHLQ
jgi:hypothetical protein